MARLNLGLLALFVVAGTLPSQQITDIQKFRIQILADSTVAGGKEEKKLVAVTTYDYVLERKGAELALRFDSVNMIVRADGNEVLETATSKERSFTKKLGEASVELAYAKAPPALKAMMDDTFTKPLALIQVDKTGKEVKRTITAGPGAKGSIDNGMVINARLFHAPFPDQDQWTAPAEVSMGSQGSAKGTLTYSKVKPGDLSDMVAVKVAGTLANPEFKPPKSPLTIKNARYEVQGEQVFDRKLRDWQAGKLTMQITLEMYAGAKKAGDSKTALEMTLERLEPKR